MTKTLIQKVLLAAAIAAGAFASTRVFAQNLLDKQLGPAAPAAKADPAKEAPATPKADAPAAAPTTPPVGGSDIVSPEAVKKVDDADLINKLTKTDDAPKAAPIKEQIGEMIDRMGASQKRLADKDPGNVTQETQRRIVADLDVLIAYARQQQQQGSSQQQQKPDQQQQQGQRQYSQGQGQQQGGSTAATGDNIPRGGAADANLNPDIHSHNPGEWGGLRPAERDLIAHGANEEYLSSYRDMIDRYYQALAELGKSRSH